MDSAASLDNAEPAHGDSHASVADVQSDFKDWLEAFTGSALVHDDAVHTNLADLIATAEPEALELLEERVATLITDLADVMEESGEDISEEYFDSLEAALAAINIRLTPTEPVDKADTAQTA